MATIYELAAAAYAGRVAALKADEAEREENLRTQRGKALMACIDRLCAELGMVPHGSLVWNKAGYPYYTIDGLTFIYNDNDENHDNLQLHVTCGACGCLFPVDSRNVITASSLGFTLSHPLPTTCYACTLRAAKAIATD